jgi:hypothetical protein
MTSNMENVRDQKAAQGFDQDQAFFIQIIDHVFSVVCVIFHFYYSSIWQIYEFRGGINQFVFSSNKFIIFSGYFDHLKIIKMKMYSIEHLAWLGNS